MIDLRPNVTRDADRGNDGSLASRTALLARWFELTRNILPSIATAHRWPIRADHCFMRVCLDVSLGAAWPQVVRPPAYQHLSDDQFAAAVRMAEDIVDAPDRLPALNARSLTLRAAWRAAGSPKAR